MWKCTNLVRLSRDNFCPVHCRTAAIWLRHPQEVAVQGRRQDCVVQKVLGVQLPWNDVITQHRLKQLLVL